MKGESVQGDAEWRGLKEREAREVKRLKEAKGPDLD
jgi:hypothetical protein